jgi:biotin synthase
MQKNQVHEKNDIFSKLSCRHDWQTDEILNIHNMPLMDLLYKSHSIHRYFHKDMTMQLASLLNIKTGGCPEDCKYCSQSAHYAKTTGLKKQNFMKVTEIIKQAEIAKKKWCK